MFSIGPQELLIIALLALVLFGPRKFLNMSRDVGRFVNETRTYTDELKSELASEEVYEARREVNKFRSELSEGVYEARREVEKFGNDLVSSGESRTEAADDARPDERNQVREPREPARKDVNRPTQARAPMDKHQRRDDFEGFSVGGVTIDTRRKKRWIFGRKR